MIKKVAVFECRNNNGIMENLEVEHKLIFNPNSIYANPESWIRKKVQQKLDNADIKLENSKIHFLANCSVPRNKIKEFAENNKIKVVRDYTKADYLVFSNNTIAKACSYGWFHKIETPIFISNLIELRNKGEINHEQYDKIIKTIDEAEYKEKVLIQWGFRRMLYEHEKITNPNVPYSNSSRFNYVDDIKICDIINNLETNNFIHQDYILQKLNSANVIDEEAYKSIRSLLNSTDESNHCIAMEIMANSDYNRSAYFLLRLFDDYSKNFYFSKFKNHVNFKALTTYFDISLNGHLDLDGIISRMKSKGVFTKKYYDIISEEYIKEVYKYMERGRFQYFGVKSSSPFFLNVDIDPESVNDNVNQEPCLNLETQTS